MGTRLTKHFTLEEFTQSKTSERLGIENNPNKSAIRNLKKTARQLEKIRNFVEEPIIITSGFRSPKLNEAVGGAKNSYHLYGRAADIQINGNNGTNRLYVICHALNSIGTIKYKELIQYETFIHIAF